MLSILVSLDNRSLYHQEVPNPAMEHWIDNYLENILNLDTYSQKRVHLGYSEQEYLQD